MYVLNSVAAEKDHATVTKVWWHGQTDDPDGFDSGWEQPQESQKDDYRKHPLQPARVGCKRI